MLLLALAPVRAQDPLTVDQIRALITGNTVTGPVGARPYAFSYTAAGEVYGDIGVSLDSGTWRIRDGDVYCHEWTEHFGGEERCYRWYPQPDRAKSKGRYRLRNVDAFRARDMWVWQIKPGLQR